MAAAAACMWVTGIPALQWHTACWAARVYEQHEAWGTHHICHSLYPSHRHAHTVPLWNSRHFVVSGVSPYQIVQCSESFIKILCCRSLCPSSHSHLLYCVTLSCCTPYQLFLPCSAVSLSIFLSWVPFIALLPLSVCVNAFLPHIFCNTLWFNAAILEVFLSSS